MHVNIHTNLVLTICALSDIHAVFLFIIWVDNISIFLKILNFKKKLKLNWEIVGDIICFGKIFYDLS